MTHEIDFCVVGGGMPGLTAALAAARHGAKVLLMQDRPVLGGNASSECRVHICGADVHNRYKNLRETGILEEIRLENLARNPNKNYSIWDTILYEKAKAEPNLTLLLNCTCLSAEINPLPASPIAKSSDRGGADPLSMGGFPMGRAGVGPGLISSITGWQLTTQTYHTVRAKIFADCSGDAILAPLTGADYRMGREARYEYDEAIAPETADERTMGMTCLFQAREYGTPQPFVPLPWANTYDRCEELPYGEQGHRWWQMGYWWLELGGDSLSSPAGGGAGGEGRKHHRLGAGAVSKTLQRQENHQTGYFPLRLRRPAPSRLPGQVRNQSQARVSAHPVLRRFLAVGEVGRTIDGIASGV
jgi:hypothetical protein